MIELVTIGICFGMLGIIVTWLLWNRIVFEQLNQLAVALVISIPFERIPSLTIADITIRPSQIITLLGVWVLFVLALKKDSQLALLKINHVAYWLLGLIAVSVPSWFFVQNETRFFVATIATWIAFIACFLVAQFLRSYKLAFKGLVISMIITSLFALYQFVGDMIGIPIMFTGLREQYTSIVFGFPRPHSTALEPLYFAGMLFVPIFAALFYWFAGIQLFSRIKSLWLNLLLLVGFLGVLLLTFSKSAIAIIFVTLGIAVISWLIKHPSIQLIRTLFGVITLVILGLLVVQFAIPSVASTIQVATLFFVETIFGNTSTAQERAAFIEAALIILPTFVLFGAGSGQFGVQAQPILKFITQREPGLFIVNNVYLEIWLENGFLALIIFVMFLLTTLYSSTKLMISFSSWKNENELIILTLIFGVFAYCLQWFSFSPIFIMPIFILIGFLNGVTQSFRHE